MQNLIFALHPLLYMVGAAAAVAGIFYFYCRKRDDGKKTTADPEHLSVTGEPGSAMEVPQDQAMVCAQSPPTPPPRARCSAPEVSEAEAEEKHQKAVAQLEVENLMSQVQTLRDTVRDMGNLIYETQKKHDEECERERRAHSTLQSKHEETKEKLKHCEELLMVSLAEAKEKHQKSLETIAQLETEKAKLKYHVETLRNTVQDMGNLIDETQKKHNEECDQARQVHSIVQREREQMKERVKHCEMLLTECESEQEAHSLLKLQYNEIKETLTYNEESLKVSLAKAEEKHQKAVKSIAQLEAEKSNLMDQVETLQDTVQDMGNLICETQKKHNEECEREQQAHSNLQSKHEETKEKLKHCEELLMECEQDWEDCSNLKFDYNEIKKTLTHNEELQKVSLPEAKEKHQKALESIAQLETEKANLMNQVETLRDTVQDMVNLIYETQKKHNEKHGIPLGSKATTSVVTGNGASRIGSTSESSPM